MNNFVPTLVAALIALTGVRLTDDFPCTEEHLLQCANSLHVHSDAQFRFGAKKEDLDLICPDFHEDLRCIDEYTRRCMAPHQRAHFYKLYASSSKVIQDICQEGPHQDEFLRHASCMWKVKKDNEECAGDYQEKIQDLSSLMSIESTDGSNEHHVRKICCSFQDFLSCSHAIMMDTCGEETAQFTKSFLDRMSSSIIQVHCEKYPSGSQICIQDLTSAGHLRRSGTSHALFLAGLSLTLVLPLRRPLLDVHLVNSFAV